MVRLLLKLFPRSADVPKIRNKLLWHNLFIRKPMLATKNITCFKTSWSQVNKPNRNNYRKMKMGLSCDIIPTDFHPVSPASIP